MLPSPDQTKPLINHVVEFARLLRRSGIPVYPGSTIELCRSLSLIDLADSKDFQNSARACLIYRHQDLAKFDALFAAFWLDKDMFLLDSDHEPLPVPESEKKSGAGVELVEDSQTPLLTYSNQEQLGTKDLGDLDASEVELARRMLRQFVLAFVSRKSRRRQRSPKGRVLDFRRLLRRTAVHGPNITELYYRRPKIRKLRLMLLCDVSGSMQRYSHFLLLFMYALRSELPSTEAAVFATRLTPIGDVLTKEDLERSLSQVAERARDWGGGTDIGGCLRQFNELYAYRMVRSDSVVVILSDGWDRGDAHVMRDEITRLRRRAFKIVWLNPLMGNPKYQPLTQGMRTALPHLDYFLPAHNLDSLQRLAKTLRRIWH